MKSFTGKLPLSVTTIIVCVFALAVILYAEDIRTLTRSSMFKLRSCSKQCTTTNTSDPNTGENEDLSLLEDNLEDEEKPVFDLNKCSVTKGKWVFNSSARPLYSDRTCPYIDRQFECVKNGRPDSDYRHWEWKPDDCSLPRFDAKITLEKLRGKRIMFVGDSLQRGQWQSFVCMIESHLPKEQKSMKRGRILSVFRAKEYNATVEFYWAPFLIESNSDEHIIGDPDKRILRVDAIAKHAKNWEGVDVLLFNTYVWWMSGLKIKSLWGSFSNGEEGFEELDAVTAYRIGLKTWANWVDSTKCRLAPQRRYPMLQRNKACTGERILGERLGQKIDEGG
ncbi:hypothetical protein QJS10_CPA03g01204 [Acorus calamus]|uniref:Trichome birefringence-like N-terminal domain-containing protein n=1 Tax=Acorus calamus TaxID=4465 RepID=A0AAV9F785_ACOCL|nr:hypothetical protein QJS10_CPA03g01204 [Acorus calamus]